MKPPERPFSVGYVVNQYPKISHSFIRREIRALERRGVRVERYAVRRTGETLVDPADIEEQRLTRIVLAQKPIALLMALLSCLAQSPARVFAALKLAFKAGWRSERGMLLHLVYLVEAASIAQWAKADAVNHLHAHFGTNSATVAMLAGELASLPFSFTVHGPEEFDKVEAIALPLKMKRAAFVAAISDYGRSQLMRWIDASQWAKLQVVRCGIDETFLGRDATPCEGHRLLCIARLSEQKGLPILIAAADLLARRGVTFSLVVAGDGPLRQSLERQVASFGLRDRVTFLGWVDEARVAEELRAARGFVLPSFAEGLPVVLMEALALGKPVVSTWVAGIPELVRNGEVGWLVPPADAVALAAAMERLLSTPVEELAQIGAAGRIAVARLHDIDVSAGQLDALMRRKATAPA
ncbi:MAG: glycosyltransferase [Hyphomicrobiales bacterium]